MTPRERMRHRLLRRRDLLVQHFHDALEQADRQLDARELEDGMLAAELWETHVLSRLGSELHELHEVIAALARLEQHRCVMCGGALDGIDRAERACSDCAVTQVMPARVRTPAAHSQQAR
jgi:hypothetical protein